MAHRITVRPYFDEVIAVQIEDGKTEVFRKSPYKIIEFEEDDIRTPFSQKTKSAKLEKQGEIKFSNYNQLYFELGDLN